MRSRGNARTKHITQVESRYVGSIIACPGHLVACACLQGR
jgi:hypothetical protein